jgi:hypothetical protein
MGVRLHEASLRALRIPRRSRRLKLSVKFAERNIQYRLLWLDPLARFPVIELNRNSRDADAATGLGALPRDNAPIIVQPPHCIVGEWRRVHGASGPGRHQKIVALLQ